MILQGLSAETLARLVTLARCGKDFNGPPSGLETEIDVSDFPEPANDRGPRTTLAAE